MEITCAAAEISTAWCRHQKSVRSKTATACVHTEEGLCSKSTLNVSGQEEMHTTFLGNSAY